MSRRTSPENYSDFTCNMLHAQATRSNGCCQISDVWIAMSEVYVWRLNELVKILKTAYINHEPTHDCDKEENRKK